jgi:hypothetical protein
MGMKKIFSMAKLSILMLMILLLSCFMVTSASAQVAELVLSCSWGDQDGEMGLIQGEELETCGPLTFCVDGKNVIILDTVNQKIVGFQGGKSRIIAEKVGGWALCGDGNDGAFLQEGSTIRHFGSGGEKGVYKLSTKSGAAPKLIEGYGNDLMLSEKGQLAVRSVRQKIFPVSGAPKVKRLSAKKSISSGLKFKIKRMLKNEIRILGENADGKILVSVPVKIDEGRAGAAIFKGVDIQGNVYVEIENIKGRSVGLEIHRYAPTGERLAVIKLSNDYYTTIYKKTEVAPDGSIYQMLTTPEGVRVLRYEKEG